MMVVTSADAAGRRQCAPKLGGHVPPRARPVRHGGEVLGLRPVPAEAWKLELGPLLHCLAALRSWAHARSPQRRRARLKVHCDGSLPRTILDACEEWQGRGAAGPRASRKPVEGRGLGWPKEASPRFSRTVVGTWGRLTPRGGGGSPSSRRAHWSRVHGFVWSCCLQV